MFLYKELVQQCLFSLMYMDNVKFYKNRIKTDLKWWLQIDTIFLVQVKCNWCKEKRQEHEKREPGGTARC